MLAASTAFYLASGFGGIIYLGVTAAVTYTVALLVKKSANAFNAALPELKKSLSKKEIKKATKKNSRRRGLIMGAALAVDFGILVVLKYYNFIALNLSSLFAKGENGLPTFDFLIPLGLSYFTFAAVGYVVDVNRGKYEPEKNFAKFFLFLSFFPHIIQGPVARFDNIAHQLTEEHSFNYDCLKRGFQLTLWGAFKKMVIADAIAPISSAVIKNADGMNGLSLWLGMFVWGIQLYTDFSGGIDISRGVAEMFGIELDVNFRRPYFAVNLTDYWNRWHITLSDWLKDYFFYPIALSKRFARFSKFVKKKFGKFIARTVPVGLLSLALFTIIGIWHGANWGEVLFGVFNGVVILISTLCEPLFEKIRKPLKMDSLFVWRLFRTIRTFILITIARVISRAPSITDAAGMFKKMFSSCGIRGFVADLGTIFPSGSAVTYLPAAVGCVILFAVSVLEERGKSVRTMINERPAAFTITVEALCIVAIAVFGAYGLGYNASGFIYNQY